MKWERSSTFIRTKCKAWWVQAVNAILSGIQLSWDGDHHGRHGGIQASLWPRKWNCGSDEARAVLSEIRRALSSIVDRFRACCHRTEGLFLPFSSGCAGRRRSRSEKCFLVAWRRLCLPCAQSGLRVRVVGDQWILPLVGSTPVLKRAEVAS